MSEVADKLRTLGLIFILMLVLMMMGTCAMVGRLEKVSDDLRSIKAALEGEG